MKFLSTLFIILFSLTVALGQDKEKKTERGIEAHTFELKSYPSTYTTIGDSDSTNAIITTLVGRGEAKELRINFDDLPEKIVIHFSGEEKRDKDIILTRGELYRIIQYLSFLSPAIGNAWNVDQPRDAK